MEEAYQLLLDNDNQMTLAEISEQVGFNSYNSFIKAFKNKYKTTPNSIRIKKKTILFKLFK